MDVKTVCLGMLTDGPASGYDLKKYFESSFGHFFPAGYGSIYPALATLARDGHVEFEDIQQDGKPDRKVYSITNLGREKLQEGLANVNPTHKVRSEFLAVLWFAHLSSKEQVDTVIDTKIEEIDEYLEMFDAYCESGEFSGEGASSGARFVAGFGRHMTHAMKSYIEENRHMLVDKIETARTATG